MDACDNSRSREEHYSVSIHVSNEKKQKKPGRTLIKAKMSLGLHSEFGEVRKLYSEDLNCNREGTALFNSTIEK